MDDLLREFLTEAAENLATLDVELVNLEKTPDDPALLGNIFRMVHTVKGTCGFLGLPRLEAVAHSAENVLGKFRDGELVVTEHAVSLILESIDRIKDILAELEANEAEPNGDDKDLIAQLDAMAEGGEAPAEEAPVVEEVAAEEPGSLFDQIGGAPAMQAAVEKFYEKVTADSDLAPFFETVDMASLQKMQTSFLTMALGGESDYSGKDLRSAHAHLVEGGLNDAHFDAVAGYLQATLEELDVPEGVISQVMAIAASTRDDVLGRGGAEQAQAAPEVQTEAAAPVVEEKAAEAASAGPAKASIASQSIRVHVDQLESLMTTVSELVLTRNQLLQMVRAQDDSEFKAPLQRLSHITTDLQEGVMKTRMQPIGNAWSKLPRIVRTLAHDLDKKIELEMSGEDTELDRQVLELIKDPLTHMVRNSGDHGLETPEERIAAGKNPVGKVRLNAYHEGGHILIEISDDGRGLNTAKLKQKIIDNNIASESEAEKMTDQQIQQYIFGAGFSTATVVTNVSGRGVGMDVVRNNIERIGGTVTLSSVEGKGTSFVIKIPLTLAIVSALIVEAGKERFAIPQISVLELVRTKGDSDHKIESINDTPVLRLRDRLLPLISLDQLLKLVDDDTPPTEADVSEDFIVVTQVGDYSFGIIVDRVFDTEEIVVKPVSPILRHITMFSGNTILGDGSVIMILDPNGISAAVGQQHLRDDLAEFAGDAIESAESEKTALLLFNAGSGGPKAVPLALVARLEEFDVNSIEMSEGRPVVQYRGQLMPLVPVEPGQTQLSEGRQPVLVFADGSRSMGLIVDDIVDIVEDKLSYEITSAQGGLLGSAVIDGKATEVIDVGYYLSQGFGNWFKNDSHTDSTDVFNLLLVDDSPFFRNLLTPILNSTGYRVTAVEDADTALKMREEGKGFDIIVSDIEMPGMSGFEFAQACRAEGNWVDTPIVALSSHAEKADFDKGRDVVLPPYN
jgi:two-component system, chemotaxis family, sensor kinase CheA